MGPTRRSGVALGVRPWGRIGRHVGRLAGSRSAASSGVSWTNGTQPQTPAMLLSLEVRNHLQTSGHLLRYGWVYCYFLTKMCDQIRFNSSRFFCVYYFCCMSCMLNMPRPTGARCRLPLIRIGGPPHRRTPWARRCGVALGVIPWGGVGRRVGRLAGSRSGASKIVGWVNGALPRASVMLRQPGLKVGECMNRGSTMQHCFPADALPSYFRFFRPREGHPAPTKLQ